MPDTLDIPKVRVREFSTPERRKPLTRVQVLTLAIRQCQGVILCGCGCGKPLEPRCVDEHLNPLNNLGDNSLSNRALYRKECAQRKTDKEDKPRAAKSRRLRGEVSTQQSRREERGGSSITGRSQIRSTGFRGHRKFDGTIVWKDAK
jgi:hypothetical protein